MTTTDNEVLVACDGSCLKNPGGPTGWAWVASDGRWARGGQASGTNQVAELWGVLSVLRDFPDVPLVIQIDSEYAMKVATRWRDSWSKNGWKNKQGETVSNLALVRSIDLALSQRDQPVRFVKVPGHDKANRWPLNTAADRHAQEAAKQARDRGEYLMRGTDQSVMAPPSAVVGRADRKTVMCSSCDAPISPLDDSCLCSI